MSPGRLSPSSIRRRRPAGRKSRVALEPEPSSDSDQINTKRLAVSLAQTFSTELPKIYAQSVKKGDPRGPVDTASGVDYNRTDASDAAPVAAELTPERMALRREAERLARLDLNLSLNFSTEDDEDL